MPNETFRVKPISRKPKSKGKAGKGKGRSAVACAAYRSGEKLYDRRLKKVFDYTRKENILHTEIMTPKDAPDWAKNRQELWNKVEYSELKSNARVSREILAALPRELSDEQNIALVREFIQAECVDKGMIADIALHNKQASDGGKNPHAHIMLTLRDIDGEKFSRSRKREWDKKSLLINWRKRWETLTNQYLEDAGSDERLSLESYAARGINKQPTIHLGHKAWALEQKGMKTSIGQHNFKVTHLNQVRQTVDALGLGLYDSTMLANAKQTSTSHQKSDLANAYQDQPLETHKRQHAVHVRKALQHIDFGRFQNPLAFVKYLQDYTEREEAMEQSEVAKISLTTHKKLKGMDHLWSEFQHTNSKDSDQGEKDYER